MSSKEGEIVPTQRTLRERIVNGITRDTLGRAKWVFPHQTDEENMQMGIRNMQGLLLMHHPEFETYLAEDENGCVFVPEELKEAASISLTEISKDKISFSAVFTSTPIHKRVAYFGGSYITAMKLSFGVWGLSPAFKIHERSYWTKERVIEEVKVFIQVHGSISSQALAAHGRADLDHGIRKVFGKMALFREEAGLAVPKKPDGYWTPETIEREAERFLASHDAISELILSARGRLDLASAIGKDYRGSYQQLRINLGIENPQRPKGYWTEETTLREARAFYDAHGNISRALLIRAGRRDLAGAISKFKWYMSDVKRRIGVDMLPEEDVHHDPDAYFDSYVEGEV